MVYFYPKASTPGCTAEACSLRDNYDRFLAAGYNVVGISRDSVKAQKNFSDKNALPFPLLSDPDASTIKAFGAWGEKKLYGKTYEEILRKTFIFNEKGELVEIIDKVEGRAEEKQSIAINFLQLGTPCEILAKLRACLWRRLLRCFAIRLRLPRSSLFRKLRTRLSAG